MPEPTHTGVYATLDGLVRLRHRTSGFSLLPRQPVQSLLAGRHASKLRGRGLDFDEIRRYAPGDDIRQIDWKATARTRKPQSRVYTEERERPVVLVVDQRLGMFFGSRRNLKSVAAAEVAALAAWRTVAGKDRVGAVVFNDSEIREVRPQRTTSTVLRILRDVLDLNHALRADSQARPAPRMLNEALGRASRLVPHDGLVVMITDGDGGDVETQRIATEIARHNDVIVVFIFDPLEAELPDAGLVVVSDGARQMEVQTARPNLRAGFREAFERRRATARRFLLTREVPVLPVSAAEPTVDQIAAALGRHRRGTAR